MATPDPFTYGQGEAWIACEPNDAEAMFLTPDDEVEFMYRIGMVTRVQVQLQNEEDGRR